MLYSFHHNFLYTHVARTGGVSLTQALQLAAPQMRGIGTQHGALAEARGALGAAFDEVYKFAFVRNPWDRLVSYRAFLAAADPGIDPAELADPDAAHWRDFEAFLDGLLRESVEIDGVARPVFSQIHQLTDAEGRLLCDRVGRFERYADDAAAIFAGAGLRLPPLGHENRSTRRGYAEYYTPAARDMVAEVCAADVAAFGYGFEAEAGGE